MNGHGPVAQTRDRGPPFRIPSAQVGQGWGLGAPGRDARTLLLHAPSTTLVLQCCS